MNKFLTKIAAAFVGIAMAIGVGVGLSSRGGNIVGAKATTETDDYDVSSIISTSYSKYEDDDLIVTFGGGGGAVGVNNNDTNWGKMNLSSYSKYAVSPVTTSDYATAIVLKVSSTNAVGMTFAYTGGTNSNKGNIYAVYSSNDTTYSQLTVTGTSQGAGLSTTSGTFTFNFSSCTGYFGVVIKSSNTSGNWKYTGVTLSIIRDVTPVASLSGLRISSGADSVKKSYDAGDNFDPTGLVVQAQWGGVWDTEHNIVQDIVWTPTPLTAGTTTVTGTYTSGTDSETVTVSGLSVIAPDVVLNKTNKPFSSTSSSNNTEENVTLSGIEYHNLGGYVYSSNYLAFNRSINGYIGNSTAFSKNIKKIVVDYSSGGTTYFTMYESGAALGETTTVSPDSSGTGKITYTFSDTKQFFKFKLTTTGTYCNINSISIFLGSTPVAKVVDTVTIATPGSVYVGKTLQLSATVTYTGGAASDSNVTWRVSSGDGVTINDSGLVTAIAATATTIEAKSVEKNSSNQQVTTTVTITPLPNRIVSVIWDTTGAKKSYDIGESLDISNITAIGTNEAGDTDVELELTTSNFSGFDSSAAANSQMITISYPNEINPGSPFTTTYSISVVAVPDIHLVNTDFSANYTDTSLTSDDGTTWVLSSIGNYSSSIQIKNGSTYGMYNTSELGRRISKVAINVKKGGVNLGFSANELDFEGTPSETGSYSTLNEDWTYTVTGDYQFLRITPDGSTQLNYIKIWYDPFVPTVTLNQSSFEFTQGATGYCDVEATASHFTNNSGVSFEATSSNQSVLDDGDIVVIDNAITIDKESVNPGTATVTVTGTYLTASEVATATFTITCNAASRNLEYIEFSTQSSDTVFTVGDTFTITDLVVTGHFDAAPDTGDVTSECTFKLWNGSVETALTPGTSTLSTAGNFTVRVSHASSAAAETLTYSIIVNALPTYSEIDFGDLYEGAKVLIVSKTDSTAVGAYGSSIYGSESVTINGSGDVTAWNNAIEFTVRIYGDRVAFEYGSGKYLGYNGSGNNAHEQTSLVEKASWTFDDEHGLLSSTDGRYLQYNSGSPRFACYTGGQHDVSIFISSNSTKTDALAADTFTYRYLHMRDYLGTEGQAGSNYCKDTGDGAGKNYFSDAATAYASLSDKVKTEFKKNTEAVKRFQAWADANGKTINLDTGVVAQKSNVFAFSIAGESASTTSIIVIISLVGLTAIGGFFFIKKRKEQ